MLSLQVFCEALNISSQPFTMLIPIALLVVMNDEDSQYIRELYIKYCGMMCRMAMSYVHNEHDAKDIVQIATVSLMKKIPKLRTLTGNDLEAYIVCTVKNAAIDFNRKASRRHEILPLDEMRYSDSEVSTEELVLTHIDIERLTSVIRKLSPEDQEVLSMRYFQGMETSEIARELGIQESSVRSRLLRAKRRLVKMYLEEENE